MNLPIPPASDLKSPSLKLSKPLYIPRAWILLHGSSKRGAARPDNKASCKTLDHLTPPHLGHYVCPQFKKLCCDIQMP